MLAVVVTINDWKPSKFPDKKTGKTFDVKRVVFRSLETNNYLYLNLDKNNMAVVNRWLPHIVEGNVLDVVLLPKGDFSPKGNVINKFESFKVIKNIKDSKEETEDGSK